MSRRQQRGRAIGVHGRETEREEHNINGAGDYREGKGNPLMEITTLSVDKDRRDRLAELRDREGYSSLDETLEAVLERQEDADNGGDRRS